jgi:uncharacterized membrane protein
MAFALLSYYFRKMLFTFRGSRMEANLSKSKLSKDLKKLDYQIYAAIGLIVLVIVIVLSTYVFWFLKLETPLSVSPTHWGAFGDYVGGILNPIIAFTALCWLVISVRIQKEELNETRSALKDSADAQKEQVRVASFTALINANTIHIQHIQYQLSHLQLTLDGVEDVGKEDLVSEEFHFRAERISIIREQIKAVEKLLSMRLNLGESYEADLVSIVDSYPRAVSKRESPV